jgi:hypothetical protein
VPKFKVSNIEKFLSRKKSPFASLDKLAAGIDRLRPSGALKIRLSWCGGCV